MSRTERFLTALATRVTWPVWLAVVIWRAKIVRIGILIVSMVLTTVYYFAGWEGVATVAQYAFQMIFAMMFMAVQFIALFWFLSKTKTIDTRPGDEGEVNFKDDYYGSEHLVKLVREWVELLTDRTKLDEMGGRAISGLLLTGPPGTGKTLLARCLATDSHAGFIGMSGSDFQAMFFGIGPMKVMNMFKRARNNAKEFGAGILFIDEIDAVGASRGGVEEDPRQGPMTGGMGGGVFGGMGSMGVLSRLLTEMDGITEIPLRDRMTNKLLDLLGLPPIDPGVVLIMGATNRPNVLDPALTRPGRIDKIIKVDMPDKRSRKLVIEGYLDKVKHESNIDIDLLVSVTSWASPALLASAIQKDAARFAIMDRRDAISQEDIEQALQENAVGMANPISDFDPDQRRQVAIHEASHTVMAWLIRPDRKIARVSIIRRGGGILGYMLDVPQTDIYALPLEQFTINIMVSLAGHIGTELILGKPWSGAGGDIENIQKMMYALALHGQFAGQIPFKRDDPFSGEEIKEAAAKFLGDCEDKTLKVLEAHTDHVLALTEALLEKDELSTTEVYAILDGVGNEKEVSV